MRPYVQKKKKRRRKDVLLIYSTNTVCLCCLPVFRTWVQCGCYLTLSLLFLRQSRQAVPDVNTEPSQNEQIIWDDPTAREERARLASNLQWPSDPTQHSELQVEIKMPDDSPSRKPVYHSEIAEQGNKTDIDLCLRMLTS